VSLLGWLTDPPADRGLHIAEPDGEHWSFYSYEHLAELTRQAAGRLRANGVGPGDVVMVVRPTSWEFIADFFGALMLGATPSPVAPPGAFRGLATYQAHIGRMAALVRPRVIATAADVAPVLVPIVGERGITLVADSGGGRPDPIQDAPSPPEVGLIQFSSGSTGSPHGVQISFAAMQANISGMRQWLRLDSNDSHASWLPLHHDMGLLGQLLLPMSHLADFSLMRPEQFVRSPVRWLRRFGPGGATGTAIPPFGLRHIVRRVRPRDLEDLDLSGWRFAVVGSERIDHDTITSFLRLFEPHGLRPDVPVPAYGMAESTLAATGVAVGTGYTTATVDTRSLGLGRPVDFSPAEPHRTTLVSCGSPIDGVTVRVVDERGNALPDGHLGELEVGGSSLGDGYIAENEGVTPFGGSLRTGDAGFLLGGELYVMGRLGDAVKELGRWLFADDVEQIAAAVSPRPQQTVALVGELAGNNCAVVLIEGVADGIDKVGVAVAEQIGEVRTLVLAVPNGSVQRTTSGKPKRRAMWQQITQGQLDSADRWDSAEPTRRS
jgi:acyl-CoA synthetase (AMP-forming)/AMP-acid ligase II